MEKNVALYSREEARKIKTEFWTTFGGYMKPIPGADGEPVNWVNYRTGIKHLYFRMDADQRGVHIGIQMTDPDQAVRLLMFEQFLAFRSLLHEGLGEDWVWEKVRSNGEPYAYIGIDQTGLNIFKKEDWPEMIRFFKHRMLLLDAFWTDAKHSFDWLR